MYQKLILLKRRLFDSTPVFISLLVFSACLVTGAVTSVYLSKIHFSEQITAREAQLKNQHDVLKAVINTQLKQAERELVTN